MELMRASEAKSITNLYKPSEFDHQTYERGKSRVSSAIERATRQGKSEAVIAGPPGIFYLENGGEKELKEFGYEVAHPLMTSPVVRW